MPREIIVFYLGKKYNKFVECSNCQFEIPAGENSCPRCGWQIPSERVFFAKLSAAFSGRYDFLRLLGIGGFAEVYLARDMLLEREVAVKILLPQHAQDPQTVERFLREARLYAKLEHKNIIPIYDTGILQGHVFITMKFIRGESLKQILATQKRIAPLLLPAIANGVAQALAYIHQQGIVHRDIKPANIIVEKATRAVYLADFGIARAESSQTLTQTGMIIGTPYYLSPEQIQGRKIDPRSDIYALGATLYELASGQPPFRGDSPLEILYQHINENPEPLGKLVPGIDPVLERVISKCIAKEPARRFQKAEEIVALIDQVEASRPTVSEQTVLTATTAPRRAKRWTLALAAAGLITTLAVAAYFLWLRPSGSTPTTAALKPPDQESLTLPAAARQDEKVLQGEQAPGPDTLAVGKDQKILPEKKEFTTRAEQEMDKSKAVPLAMQPAVAPANTEAKQPLDATPPPERIRFSSFPPAADVYLHGEKIGSTEQMFEKIFPPGKYTFQFVIAGFQSADVTVTVAAGKTVKAHHRFPQFRSFTVTARPFGRVWVDGKEYGDTPQTIKLSFGEHLVRVTKDGYLATEQRIFIDSGAKNSAHFELEKGGRK